MDPVGIHHAQLPSTMARLERNARPLERGSWDTLTCGCHGIFHGDLMGSITKNSKEKLDLMVIYKF